MKAFSFFLFKDHNAYVFYSFQIIVLFIDTIYVDHDFTGLDIFYEISETKKKVNYTYYQYYHPFF